MQTIFKTYCRINSWEIVLVIDLEFTSIVVYHVFFACVFVKWAHIFEFHLNSIDDLSKHSWFSSEWFWNAVNNQVGHFWRDFFIMCKFSMILRQHRHTYLLTLLFGSGQWTNVAGGLTDLNDFRGQSGGINSKITGRCFASQMKLQIGADAMPQ